MILPHVTLVNSPCGATCSFEKNEHTVLFNYFVPKDCLRNPRGSLSSAINSQTISSANRVVETELAMLQKLTAKRKAHAQYTIGGKAL